MISMEGFGVVVGEVIRDAREKREIPPKDLFERAGMPGHWLARAEGGELNRLGMRDLWRISGALGMGVDDLLAAIVSAIRSRPEAEERSIG